MQDLSELWRILQVVFGIGLVIFVHEAGHFIAARLCGVRVDVFSLGFGPRLFGWRRGTTLYQVALVPLGGYVKMAGEELAHGGHGDGPSIREGGDLLYEKSIGQRFFIYSGGVLMNVLFGLVVFPFVLFAGVPVISPVLGAPIPGSPAWERGIEAGSRVTSVNGKDVFDFMHIPTEVALSGSDPVVFELVPPGGEVPVEVTVPPEYNAGRGVYMVGVRPSFGTGGRIEVAEDSPATAAGLTPETRVLEIIGGEPELSLDDQLRLAFGTYEPVTLRVADASGERVVTIEPRWTEDPGRPPILGVEPAVRRVEALRPTPVARSLGLALGDRVVSVNGRDVLRPGDFQRGLFAAQGPLVLVVERGGRRVTLEAAAIERGQVAALSADVALVPDTGDSVVSVFERSGAWDAGLRPGDRIVAIDGQPVAAWDDIPSLVQGNRTETLSVRVERSAAAGAVSEHEFVVTPRSLPLPSYGFSLSIDTYTYQVDSLGAAISGGVSSSWRFLVDVWLTLKSILSSEVSAKNIGGIITIAAVSHDWAAEGWSKLFFFLCLLSMNLAFLNVLPIPVLDGGHLFFLIVEKIKGSPVSERTLGYSQVIGLVMIVSLMVYVTYNDVVRWFLS